MRGPGPIDRRSRRDLWALVAVAALTVGGVAAALLWPRSGTSSSEAAMRIPAPVFVATFGTEGEGRLQQPVGITVEGNRAYVADAGRRQIVSFTLDGEFVRAFGADRLLTPLYVARNPLDGLLYVTDRGLKSIATYKVDGSFVETFSASADDAAGSAVVAAWQPLALAFAEDGSLYVSDVGARQRIVHFSPTLRYRGESPLAMQDGPLSFVNGIAVSEGTVVASDSNNARLVTFTGGLGFVRAAAFGGLPRGICALPGAGGTVFAVANATGGDVLVSRSDGRTLATAGSQGAGEAGLLQPTGVATDGRDRLFVTDTGHARVSVWRVAAATSTGVFDDILGDPRWWFAAGIVLAGAAGAVSIILSGRKRRRTI